MHQNFALPLGAVYSIKSIARHTIESTEPGLRWRKLGRRSLHAREIEVSSDWVEQDHKVIRRRPTESRFLERPQHTLAVRPRPLRGSSIRRQHQNLLKELRLAEQVQRSMLPRVLPNLPQVEFGAAHRPTSHLAGDFYNVMRLDRDNIGVCLGDVMGHGAAAALLAVFALQGLRTKIIEGSSYQILAPAEVLSSLSRDILKADFYESPFITMIYGCINAVSRSFTYCCGGHPPALLLREGQASQRLEGRSSVLGVFELPFEQDVVELQVGDRVVLYNDGAESIVWGMHGAGVEGLGRILSQREGGSPQELIDRAIQVAEPGGRPADDLTLMMFEMRS